MQEAPLTLGRSCCLVSGIPPSELVRVLQLPLVRLRVRSYNTFTITLSRRKSGSLDFIHVRLNTRVIQYPHTARRTARENANIPYRGGQCQARFKSWARRQELHLARLVVSEAILAQWQPNPPSLRRGNAWNEWSYTLAR